MTEFKAKSEFIATLQQRGYIHQCSDFAGLDALAAEGKAISYVGYDCTAPSLHIGHLISIMMLAWLQRTGNTPITLMGGGTTRVGDPSGKDETRKILTIEQIDANKDEIKKTFSRFLDFGSAPGAFSSAVGTGSREENATNRGNAAIMADNAEWLAPLNYIEFLRDVGRHFSVNRMLSMDSVKMRLERENELSFIEFNYMLLQSYDFVELSRRYGCNLQMGGSDQWGNIVNGIDLGRRMGTPQLHALTCPLLTTASGAKMGKTASGAVWLNADMLSPYDYWQFWRNTEDADVGRFLKLFTFMPLAEIARLEALGGAEINEAKKQLATEATALMHGREAAQAAADTAHRAFDLGENAAGLPSFALPRSELTDGLGLLTALVQVGFCTSTGEARRAVANSSIMVNSTIIREPARKLGEADIGTDGVIKLSFGKKKHILLRPE